MDAIETSQIPEKDWFWKKDRRHLGGGRDAVEITEILIEAGFEVEDSTHHKVHWTKRQ